MSPTSTRRAGTRTRVAPEPRRAPEPGAASARTSAADRSARGAEPAVRRPAARTAAKPAPKPVPKPASKPAPKAVAKPAPKAAGTNPAAGRSAASRDRARRPANTPRPVHVPAPRAPFVLLVIGLLGGALVSLLLLNTVLAEDAFTLSELQRNNKLLSQQRQALQEEIAREEAPDRLAQKAINLGMTQPNQAPAFIDGGNGQIKGASAARPVPHAAAASAGVVAVVGVPGVVVSADELAALPAAGGAQAQPGSGPAEGAR